MNRKWEKGIGITGALLVVIFLGGFAVTINQINMADFQDTIVPIFKDVIPNIETAEGLESMKTLGAWFSVTVFLTIIMVALGTLFVTRNKYPKRAAIFYGLAGLVVLIGSQLIAFPLAFIFFVVAGLCMWRQPGQQME
ncbi:hypothetical protein LZ578_00180 [Jeotgalibaca sp. MA1X17-3]|uniref:hypothetical protein n=1 Tax=Jeotgalibaca sp. MA1X17-3 TaxID=2908211 RepID=UPI001F38BD07|nr:hypothetical protein [Jeotgalibaca sp. MA1X17-3]UJF15668.1 hypothetical protein LZ578_00180 [Jeotgalibaca sp. MA1X17-3]